jgi:type IV secretory pathway TraG/TraD family ATPase VirD4
MRELPDEEELIFIPGQRIIRAAKIRDYRDPILKHRLNLPQAPGRGLDGVYPDLPHPNRPSPWDAILDSPNGETILTIEATIPEAEWTEGKDLPAPKPKKAKRKLIAASGD